MKKLYRTAKEIILMYVDYNISGKSAQLSYYMLFAFFPLLLLVNSVIGTFSHESISLPFESVIPKPIRDFVASYIRELEGSGSNKILTAGAILTVWSLARYVRSYRKSIKTIYRHSRQFGIVWDWVISFLFSVGMLLLFCLAIFSVFFTEKILETLALQGFAKGLWYILRLLIVGSYAFFVICSIHFAQCGEGRKFFDFAPGALSSVVIWTVVSAVFSYYVGKFADYSMVYGSIGNVILLLIFLNITNTILLGASIINIVKTT